MWGSRVGQAWQEKDVAASGEVEPVARVFCQGPNYSVTEDGMIATKDSHTMKWDASVLGPEMPPGSAASVKLLTTNVIFVGLAPNSINRKGSDNFKECGVYLYCNSPLTKYSKEAEHGVPFSNGIKATLGSIIGISLTTDGDVNYTVDGVPLGTAFRIPVDDEAEEYRLAVLMHSCGDAVELVY